MPAHEPCASRKRASRLRDRAEARDYVLCLARWRQRLRDVLTMPCRSFSPMPHLVVRVAQFGDLIATNGLDARNHIAGIEPPLRGVLGDVMDLHTLVDQIGRVAGQPRGLHLLPPAE